MINKNEKNHNKDCKQRFTPGHAAPLRSPRSISSPAPASAGSGLRPGLSDGRKGLTVGAGKRMVIPTSVVVRQPLADTFFLPVPKPQMWLRALLF